MAQSDVIKFLKKNKGKWFYVHEYVEKGEME